MREAEEKQKKLPRLDKALEVDELDGPPCPEEQPDPEPQAQSSPKNQVGFDILK